MKYHIFIGSTLDDVKNERKELIRIVMELGHIPVVADNLDESARNAARLLEKTIEECDFYIALVAHKYSAKDGSKSPLIGECIMAEKKGVPVLALIIDEKARWKPIKKEKDPAFISKLDGFKAKLREGLFETWHNTPDLCQKAQSLLVQEFCVNSRPGWIRTSMTIEPCVANELSRLSVENSVLRRQFFSEDRDIDAKLQDEQKRALKTLALNKVSLSFYYTTGSNWENTRQFRLLRIFKLLVPELSLGKTSAEISRFLGTVLNPDLDKTVRKSYPTPSNTIRKIMADFSVLKLVRHISDKEAKAGNEVWEITEYGRDLYSVYRTRQLEKALVKKN